MAAFPLVLRPPVRREARPYRHCLAGRKKAQEYFKVYKENIPVSQLVRELASIMQEFTQSG